MKPFYLYKTMTKRGFTLIEISIVLIIIGLITGSILVGHDLYNSAQIRQQITQIEQYESAILTFKNKYNFLPGDLPANDADSLDMKPRAGTANSGDGDGVIEYCEPPPFSTPYQWGCENILIWTDLSKSGLIPHSFTKGEDGDLLNVASEEIKDYFPALVAGSQSVFHMVENEISNRNWYLMMRILQIINPSTSIGPMEDISAVQAYYIDSKMDDGSPISGNVQIFSISFINPSGFFFNPPSRGSGWCVASDNTYNLEKDPSTCQMRVKSKVN